MPSDAPAPSVPQASAAGAPLMPAAVTPLAPTALSPPTAGAAAHGEAWPGPLTLPPGTATAQASLGAAMQVPALPMMAGYLRPEHVGLGFMSRVHDFVGEAPLPAGLGIREGVYGHIAQALPDGAYGVQMLQGMGQAFAPPLGQAQFPPGMFAGVVDGQILPQGFAHAVATIGEPAAYLSFNAQGQ